MFTTRKIHCIINANKERINAKITSLYIILFILLLILLDVLLLYKRNKKIIDVNIDVNKQGIVAKLNHDGKSNYPQCNTFLDDIVGAIAAAASTRVAQIISEDEAAKK